MTTPLPPFTLNDLKKVGHIMAMEAMAEGYLFLCHGVEHEVSAASLALLDTRLPLVVHALTTNYQNAYPSNAARALKATLRYWDMPQPIRIKQDYLNQPSNMVFVLDDIVTVRTTGQGAKTKKYLHHATYHVVTHAGVMFVSHVADDAGYYSTAWCEQHFPGSVARLAACRALDLDGFETATLSFYNETATPVEVLSASTLPPSLTEHLP